MIKPWFIISLSLFITCTELKAQNNTENNITTGKTTVAISLRRYLNVLFQENSQTPEFLFTQQITGKSRFRAATSILLSSGDGEPNAFNFSLGLDKTFKTDKNWRFYYGGDALFQVNTITGRNQSNFAYAALPFLGISYQIGKHIILATEPGIYFVYRNQINPEAFIEQEDSFDIGLYNLGHLRVHFVF